MTVWCTRALMPALSLMLVCWSMTCCRGHVLLHDEEHSHHEQAPHHHGPFEHTHHTEPGDPDHTSYKPDANRHGSNWRLDLTLVLQQSVAQLSLGALGATRAGAAVELSTVAPAPHASSRAGRHVLLMTERWLA